MTSTHTGLDPVTAAGIPVGSTLTLAYWTVPASYGTGEAHATEADAIAAGVAEHENAPLGAQQRFAVDLRWEVSHPEGGSTDFVVSRTNYASVAEAVEHLSRIEKYSPAGL